MKKYILICCSLFVFSVAIAQEKRYSTQLSMGIGFGPETYYIAGSGEYYLTKLFSLGPMIQSGLTENFTVIIPTLNFRLDLPVWPWKEVKTSLVTGVGWMYREVFGTSFEHY